MATFKTPFYITEAGKVAVEKDPNKGIEQQIIDVLTTAPYERPINPGYGANAMSLLYEPVDELLYAEFRTDALIALAQRVSSASIVNLVISPSTTSNYAQTGESVGLDIRVQYRTNLSVTQTFSFKLTVPSELTEEYAI
jgi:phage baseplate assembly protein W